MIRKIVQIDSEKCDGCGLCVPSCAEGAIKIVNGKAVLAADNLCDGLGACLGECPRDAIRIVEREADEFDEAAVARHVGREAESPPSQASQSAGHEHHDSHHGGCPGSRPISLSPRKGGKETDTARQTSRLRQWPVQLRLAPTAAPYFQDADILVCADCVPFAYAEFHRDFLEGKVLLVGCPKLDDNDYYREKLTELFRTSAIRSVTVLRMEVPCCGGIVTAAREAIAASGKDIPFNETTITISGEIKE